MEILSNIDEACRLCLRGEGKISVFEDDCKTRAVTPENIYDCVSVKITKDDKLPKGICESCLLYVKSWCSFKNTCDETQRTLQEWILSDNLEKGLEKNTCFPTRKEDIKISSCNTYKIEDGGNTTMLVEDLFDISNEKRLEICPKNERNSVCPLNIMCNDERLPTVNECETPCVSRLDGVERLPDIKSQAVSGGMVCDSLIDGNEVLSKSHKDIDTPEISTQNLCISVTKSSVNILDEARQSEIHNVSNTLVCKYVTNSDNELRNVACDSIMGNNKDHTANSAFIKKESTEGITVTESDVICVLSKNGEISSAHFDESSCSSSTHHKTESQENMDISKFESGSEQSSNENSLIDSTNNNVIENIENSTSMDAYTRFQERVESSNSCAEGTSNSPSVSNNVPTKTQSNEGLVDSDKENCVPSSSGIIGSSLKKTDSAKDKQSVSDVEGNENSVEGDGCLFPDIRIISTSTLAEDIDYNNSFTGNNCGTVTEDQNLQQSNESNDPGKNKRNDAACHQTNADIKSVSGSVSDDLVSSSQSCDPGGSTEQKGSLGATNLDGSTENRILQVCTSEKAMKENEILQVTTFEESPEQDQILPYTSLPQVSQNMEIEERHEDRNPNSCNLELQMQPSADASQQLTSEPGKENPTDSGFSSSVALNIKQEPVDHPEVEVDQPPEMSFNIRVKSEFSSFGFEEDINDYETIDGSTDKNTSDASLTNDGSNTECRICNRRYASVGNFTKHLLTKVHLYNAGLGGTPEGLPVDITPQDSPMLRSRLSGEPLNLSPEESLPSTSISSPPSKRKITEHCDLCNVSFGYISEYRRHLLSKKHRENVRLMKAAQSSPGKTSNDNKSIFICPIENCHFSCLKGVSLLSHMKIHGIEQPVESKVEEQPYTKPKLSARQQDLLRKDSEKRKLLAQQQLQLQQQQQLIQQQQQQQHLQLQLQLQQDLEEEEYSDDYIPPGHSRDYECEGCHKTFIRESGLRKHGHYCTALESVEAGEQTKEEEWKSDSTDNVKAQKLHCPLCDISFGARNVFVNHVQIYHKGSNLENGLLKLHKKPPVMQLSNKLRVANKKGLGFLCNICGKKFNLLSSLNFHLKSHSVSLKHICRICKEGFNARKAFMEHCRMHFLKPGSKETLCHKCFKVFKTRSELYYHRKNDMCSIKLKIYSCNLCQHSFKDPSALEEHKIVYHSESLDMSEDAAQSSSIGELYDDSLISVNPISGLSSSNDNLPGTSSKTLTNFNNKHISNYSCNSPLNFSNKSYSNFSSKLNSHNYIKPPAKSPFHCEICNTDYATKQTLRKHIKKFHILNIPYMGSRKYNNFKKGNILQANTSKQWKCRHCKTAFGSRKILVLHLKKCQFNVLDLAKGMCYQCGKWCESGKTRICRFCLPDLSKASKPQRNNFLEGSSFQKPDYQSFHSYKPVKQEVQGESDQGFLGVQDYSSLQKQHINFSTEKFPVTIKSEQKEISKSSANVSKNDVNSRKNIPVSINNIQLMKCPIGNKYFRNEMIMIKHYSQCDGNCENRCSHCRRMFNSPKEYKLHLINSKCFGPKRTQSRMKYPSFGSKKKYSRPSGSKQDLSFTSIDIKPKFLAQRSDLDEVEDKMPDDSSDITLDMSTVGSTLSEESYLGLDSSASTSANRVMEEKSLKMGRVCTMCDKVITMQRGIYRHVYGCFKVFMLSQESVSCRKCLKTFSKHNSMKENTAAIKQHVLDCHFIPYYIGEGLAEDGSHLNTPPPLLCYVCSFGFTSNTRLQQHIKDHRSRKDEINSIVLQLEDELLSDERLADEKSICSLYVELKNSFSYTVKTGRTLALLDCPPDSTLQRPQVSGRRLFQCDKCSRSFTNRNKFLRHKKVHGIVKESVLHEVTENVLEFMNDNIPSASN